MATLARYGAVMRTRLLEQIEMRSGNENKAFSDLTHYSSGNAR
ncbi:hypothetical protein AmDm5_1807 [Acetobacter malorum]|nr:hypothetical protein AmDm5_1807 [Acetobacter malorum]